MPPWPGFRRRALATTRAPALRTGSQSGGKKCRARKGNRSAPQNAPHRIGLLAALQLSVVVARVPFEQPWNPWPVRPARSRSVTDFGAVGDNHTVNTAAFSRAIAAVESRCGGVKK